MEQPFEVAIDIDIEYEVGSPPSAGFDVDLIEAPELVHHESIWMSREGADEGEVTSATTKLYPNFSDDDRRTVFCVATNGVGGTTAIAWNGATFLMGKLWLNTDPNWTSSGQTLTSPGEGAWFACEGELEADYRVVRPGGGPSFSL